MKVPAFSVAGNEMVVRPGLATGGTRAGRNGAGTGKFPENCRYATKLYAAFSGVLH
jgi:hypothetical protein